MYVPLAILIMCCVAVNSHVLVSVFVQQNMSIVCTRVKNKTITNKETSSKRNTGVSESQKVI